MNQVMNLIYDCRIAHENSNEIEFDFSTYPTSRIEYLRNQGIAGNIKLL